MTRAAFLLSKDPATAHGGDVTMTRLLMGLVAEDHEVVAVCLSPDPTRPAEPGLVRVRKEPARPLPVAVASVRRRRSLVHARFDSAAFRAAVDDLEADLYIAEHSYMAEPFLRSRRAGRAPLFVNTHVPESLVWNQTRSRLLGWEGRRIERDERRVALAARAVATFDAAEAADLRGAGVRRAHWLELTTPAQDPVDVAGSAPRLVFLGDQTWRPNAEAADLLRAWWPEIAAGIPGAELVVAGASGGRRPGASPPGVTELGFVDDLPGLLGTCRALVAPIRTGGGVRVKILEAASRGLPVVATTAGVGSLATLLGITQYDEQAAFVSRCRALLADPGLAAADGARLHTANARHWAEGRPKRSVRDWLDP